MSNVYYSTLLNTHCFKAACVMETALSFKDIFLPFSMFFFFKKSAFTKKRCGSVLVQNVLYILCLQAIQHHFIFIFTFHIQHHYFSCM